METIEIQRAAVELDVYGDPIPGMFSKLLDLEGAQFAPANPSEPVEVGRNVVITGGVVYWRGEASPGIAATDRAVIRGQVFEIDGDIGEWARESLVGIQFAVKRGTDRGAS